MWCAPLPTPGPAPDTAPAQKKLKHLRVDATSMQVSLPVAMTWWAQRSALPRTRRVGRCRGGCAGGRCCTCRSGIRTALPDARIAVDKWHLVALANLMVPQVRQRITRQLHGRRGTATDKVWASRQLLLTGYEHLTVKQKARFNAALAAEDPTNEIAAAHAVKERLRLLLAEHQPHQIRRRLYDFYDAAARADMEETSRLATTIDTWRPAVLVALTEDVTNARTEGFNRIIKQTKRVGCGFTNMDNYRRRIMVHIALTRGQRPAA